MRYEEGYTSSWRLCAVDDLSWEDGADLGHVVSASVTHSIDADAPSVDSANAELSASAPAVGTYVRLWMDARASGELVRVPIVTGRVTPSTAERMGALRLKSDVAIESVLAPAEEAEVDEGWYAPVGADGAVMAASLLRKVVDAPVSIAAGARPVLPENVVAGSDNVLTIAWALLGDTWEIVTTGRGEVVLRPRATSPTATVTDAMLCTKLTEGTEDDGTVKLDYTREWSDEIGVGTGVRIAGDGGLWRVVSQRVECGCGATVAETVRSV
jgi:hypothetical protein